MRCSGRWRTFPFGATRIGNWYSGGPRSPSSSSPATDALIGGESRDSFLEDAGRHLDAVRVEVQLTTQRQAQKSDGFVERRAKAQPSFVLQPVACRAEVGAHELLGELVGERR